MSPAMNEDMNGVCPKCGKRDDSGMLEFAIIEVMLCPCGYAWDKASGVDCVGEPDDDEDDDAS